MKTKFATDKEYRTRTCGFVIFARAVLFSIAVILLMCVASLAFAAEPQKVAEEAGINGWHIAGSVVVFLAVMIGLHFDGKPHESNDVWIGWGDQPPKAGVEPEKPRREEPRPTIAQPIPETRNLPKPERPAPPMPICRAPMPDPALGRATDLPEDRRRFPQPPEGFLPSTHRDDLGVFMFSIAMKDRLKYCREVDGKHGWWDPTICDVSELVVHLKLAMRKGNLVDIANLCMMLHQRGETKI